METRVIKVGTSLGLIIPKVVANEVGFKVGTPLNLNLNNDRLIITKIAQVRAGWAEAFEAYSQEGGDEMLLPDFLDSETDKIL